MGSPCAAEGFTNAQVSLQLRSAALCPTVRQLQRTKRRETTKLQCLGKIFCGALLMERHMQAFEHAQFMYI